MPVLQPRMVAVPGTLRRRPRPNGRIIASRPARQRAIIPGVGTPKVIRELDEESLQSLYGRWDSLDPPQVAALLAGSGVRWWIAGGWAARIGAEHRQHDDTDTAVRIDDLAALREHLQGWHLWEAHAGSLRPLLAGDDLTEGRQQLWIRRDSQHPWRLDILLDRSGDDEWVFKRDASVRLPWAKALQTVDGIRYLKPEVALLHKAHLDRPKDRADLAAARLDPQARAWLAATLDKLGSAEWAELVRVGAGQHD
jgi:hypothetical protein